MVRVGPITSCVKLYFYPVTVVVSGTGVNDYSKIDINKLKEHGTRINLLVARYKSRLLIMVSAIDHLASCIFLSHANWKRAHLWAQTAPLEARPEAINTSILHHYRCFTMNISMVLYTTCCLMYTTPTLAYTNYSWCTSWSYKIVDTGTGLLAKSIITMAL